MGNEDSHEGLGQSGGSLLGFVAVPGLSCYCYCLANAEGRRVPLQKSGFRDRRGWCLSWVLKGKEELLSRRYEGRAFEAQGTAVQSHGALKECTVRGHYK